jgi:hypothetical protein
MFECTKLISADQVKATIRTIPGFGLFGKTPLPASQVRSGEAVPPPPHATEASSTVS